MRWCRRACAKSPGRKARSRPERSPSIAELLAQGKRIVLVVDRAERTDPRIEDHRAGPEGHAVRRHPGRHEGRHHPRQRRRRRRRLRAAGRSCRHPGDAPARTRTASNTDVVLQNVRVLAIDQLADDASDKPIVVKAVTLEVDTVAAQRLSLAGSVGALVARAAQGRRAERRGHAPRHACIDLESPSRHDARCGRVEAKTLATVTVTRARQGTGLQRAGRRRHVARSDRRPGSRAQQ